MSGILSLLFLFGHGFLRRDFADRREIWHEASPIYQTGLLKFWGQYRKGRRNCSPWRHIGWICVLVTLHLN